MGRILCIDTDEQYAKYICSHLVKLGHQCLYVNHGKDVLSLLEKHKIDLLLCEVMLPDVCGFEISRRIRAHPEFYLIPIVLMSTMSEESEVMHGYAQGVDAYLSKPVDLRVLETCISQKLAEAAIVSGTDPGTGLSSSKKIRSIIQRNVLQRKHFALLYIELMASANLAKTYGAELRDKAIRRLARIIRECGDSLNSSLFEAGHMGGGHFICVVEPTHVRNYCQQVQDLWAERRAKILASLPPTAVRHTSNPSTNDLALLLCATANELTAIHAPNEYFDTLAQLRNKALATGEGGLYIDHRRRF